VLALSRWSEAPQVPGNDKAGLLRSMPIAAAAVAQPVQLYRWPGNGLAEKVSLNPLAVFGISATTR
jgi:hypothetical protein